MVEIPSRQERDWLTAFGTSALFVACSSTKARCAIGATQDLARALAAQRRQLGRDARLARVWWSTATAALELARAVDLPPGTTVKGAKAAVRQAARRRGIPLAEHETTLERVRTALAKLDHGLEVAKQRGVLWEFNARFKFLRQKQPQLDYGRAHAKLKAEIARRLAESGGGLPDLGGIVDTVLPLPTK
jgi:hypothetical protein